MTAVDRLFAELGIALERHRHPPVHTVEAAEAWWTPLPGAGAKNLFLKDAKGALFLVTIPSERSANLKTLPEKLGSKRLSFGSAALLMEVLGVEAGAVTPLAAANDPDRRVTVAIDSALMETDGIKVHPLVNTETVIIPPSDLLRFLRACGHEPLIADFAPEPDRQ